MSWAYIFRKKPDEPHNHDWNMEFPDKENPSLGSSYVPNVEKLELTCRVCMRC